ncbi:MAG: CotH kinase family protein [Bacteroidales bacterium]|nr:CotH kinase family protein [Bacteroidales bacterium]
MKHLRHLFLLAISVLGIVSCREDIIPEEPGGGTKPFLDVEQTELAIGHEGGTVYTKVTANGGVAVNSNVLWCSGKFVSTPDSDIELKSVGPRSAYLKVTVAPNGKMEERSAKIVLSASGCEDVTVTVLQDAAEAPKSPDCDLLTFRIDEAVNGFSVPIKFDADARTLTGKYLKWIEKENPEMLIPTFTTNGYKVFVGGDEVVSGTTAISFADDFVLTVMAENGDTKDYSVSLNCPQINRELPCLHIRPERLISGKTEYVQTYIELFDKTPGSTGEGWWDSAEKGKIEVRGRGNSTWGLPKKPFRLKFTEEFSPIGLNHAKEKSWVIMSQDMDKSLIRNCIAFEYSRILFNAAEGWHHEKALNFTPCMQLINVYFTGDYYYSDTRQTSHLDGEYFGVYQMSDQMQRKPGRIAVDKLKAADGSDPEKITGGYIIETDLHEGNHYSPRKRIRMTYKYPEDDDFDQAQYDYITNFIGKAEDALYSSNFKDPDNGWRKYMDEKTMADFIIIKELVGDLDGYTSTYMYKRRGVDKLFFGPIWDCDKGWNNDNRTPHWEYPPLSSLMINAGFWMPSYVNDDWFQHVWKDETFRAFVAKRWAAKKDELLSATNRLLDELPVRMSKAVDANFTVWKYYYQYSSEANMPAKTYPEEIERIRTLTEQRARLLDQLFNK